MHAVKIACERPDDLGRSLSQWDCTEIARQLVRDGVVAARGTLAELRRSHSGEQMVDLTAGLVGGLGVAPGANIGTEAAVFEATHGSAPKYTGQNRVNPTAMILSGKLMLEYIGEREAAQRLEEAVAAVIAEGDRVTYDLKPTREDPTAVGTSEYADAIIERLG